MEKTNANNARPLLIYDGDCGFCLYWARYWQKLTGESVVYAPYQEVAAQYPAISPDQFRSAIQYVTSDGKISCAAEASFMTLSHAPGQGIWLWFYRHLPGFAWLTEFFYAFIAAHRPIFYKFSLFLWGRDYAPPQFALVSWLFLRGLGFIYLFAFASFAVQALGLIGSHGILPLSDFVRAAENNFGVERYWLAPMVFWWGYGDAVIQAVCWGGVALSVLLIANILPRLSLIVLYVLYLSLLYAGQTFMTFQWDTLLLEAGFLGLIVSLSAKTGIWLVRWLIFRFMFLSGSVKLLSGDPSWADLSALSYHFQTQPLPTPLGWYAHHIPAAGLVFATVATFVVELGLPFLIFMPRRLRFGAAFGFLFLELLIFLTGNYNFFNLLTMLICLPLFDDAALYAVMPKRLIPRLQQKVKSIAPRKVFSIFANVMACLIVFASCGQMYGTFHGHRAPAPFAWVNEQIDPLHFVNSYGLFAVMTTKRLEIVIEGSDDGVHWKEYGFKYKPGDIDRAPLWNIPHQPRLDWQMWFAALGTRQQNPWMTNFLERILNNTPEVMALLGDNPFPDKPPVYVRALMYDYRYTTKTERDSTGAWWHRELLGAYFPQAKLTHSAAH